jgi:hypothetical protein
LSFVIFSISFKELIFSIVKTSLVYLLAAFYFLISVRLTVNVHYCGGKVQKVSLIGFSKQRSCCEGRPMKKGCCEDVQLCFKKNSVDQKTSSSILFFASVLPENPYQAFPVQADHELYVPKTIRPSVNAPPPELKIPLHLKHCVFII